MTWTGPMVRAAALGGLLAAAVGGVAAQEGAAPAGKGWMGRFDADKDGAVGGAELAAVTDRRFQRLDGNRDGFLSREELPDRGAAAGAAREAADDDGDGEEPEASTAAGPGDAAAQGRPRKGRLERLDRDDDGRLSREEFETTGQALLRRLDKNRDGRVTPEEAPRPQQQDPEQG